MTCVYSHTASHAESDTELPANNQGEIISIHSTPYTRNILPNRTRHGHSTQQGVLTQAEQCPLSHGCSSLSESRHSVLTHCSLMDKSTGSSKTTSYVQVEQNLSVDARMLSSRCGDGTKLARQMSVLATLVASYGKTQMPQPSFLHALP